MQMARDAEGMTQIVRLTRHRRRQRRRSADRRQEHRREQSRQVQLVRRRPLLGPAAGRGRLGGSRVRRRRSRASPMAASSSPRAASAIAHDGQALAEHMMGEEIDIEVDLGAGNGDARRMIGIDLGPGYIKENSKTS